jgi:hypothetical protein
MLLSALDLGMRLSKNVYTLPPRLAYIYQRFLFTRAIRNAYQTWMMRFPRWVNAGFDEYFLLNDAMPLLLSMMSDGQSCNPADLARKWASVYRLNEKRTERAMVECTPVAAHFVTLLQMEYTALQNSFQPMGSEHLAN